MRAEFDLVSRQLPKDPTVSTDAFKAVHAGIATRSPRWGQRWGHLSSWGKHGALERCSATKILRQAAIISCRANTGVCCWRQAIRACLRCWKRFFNTSTSLTQALFSTTAATDRAVTDRASSPCWLKGKSKSVGNDMAEHLVGRGLDQLLVRWLRTHIQHSEPNVLLYRPGEDRLIFWRQERRLCDERARLVSSHLTRLPSSVCSGHISSSAQRQMENKEQN